MDSLAMFIFIWAVIALFSVWLTKYLYGRYKAAPADGATHSRQSSVAPGGGKVDKLRLSEPKEILASKSEVNKDASGKGSGIGGRVGGRPTATAASSAGAGTTAAGTSLRRRMVRQSSTGPENRKRRYVPPPSNVVGPETTSVTWTSQVFRWLYSDLVIVNELLISWVIALNETLRKSIPEHGIIVEVVRVLPDSPPPGLSNIFCNCEENNPPDMVITLDCDAMPVLQVKTLRQKSGKSDTSHYKVTVSRFRARLAITMNYNKLCGEMRLEGYPDIRITMNSVGAIKPMDQDEQQFQDNISDILMAALRDTVYPVDFSTYSTCPRAESDTLSMPTIYPSQYDVLSNNMEGSNAGLHCSASTMVAGRRLLVKIVKGEGLTDANDPYVVVEMDEPPQKNQTGARQGSNPYWDEHFLFELVPHSAEILFEVYDRPSNLNDAPTFLGLGLVGIDELAVGPASTQVLTLQPRPYEAQAVAGAIIVDFVFIEGAEIPAGPRPYKLKEALRIDTAATAAAEGVSRSGVVDVADAAVRALQDGALSGSNAGNVSNKSTLIIHSVQRNHNTSNAFKVELNADGKIEMKEKKIPTQGQSQSDEIVLATLTTTTPNDDNIHDGSGAPRIIDGTCLDSTSSNVVGIGAGIGAGVSGSGLERSTFNDDVLDSPSGTGNANVGNHEKDTQEVGRPLASSSPITVNGAAGNSNNIMNNNNNNNNNMIGNNNISTNTNVNNFSRNGMMSNNGVGVGVGVVNSGGGGGGGGIDGGGGGANISLGLGLGDGNIDGVDERGRSKKRNFFGTLKKRLSRSKTRTHSVDRGASTSYNNNGTSPTGTLNGDSRSFSVDRAILSKSNSVGPRIGVPTLDHSRRSSISESSAISGLSTASNKTYIHEASTLVLETIENGIKRHFIVPLAIAQRPRWRRKGTKLHIYNDHTFIAKHLSGGGLLCSICMKSIPRRPGKQGYECRDCQMICHKQCHVRAPQSCPNPTVLSMELSTMPDDID